MSAGALVESESESEIHSISPAVDAGRRSRTQVSMVREHPVGLDVASSASLRGLSSLRGGQLLSRVAHAAHLRASIGGAIVTVVLLLGANERSREHKQREQRQTEKREGSSQRHVEHEREKERARKLLAWLERQEERERKRETKTKH